MQVTGTGYADPKFSGGVDDGDQQANWYKGDARITFTDVVPQPGKDFVWVCGDITADVVGAQKPPPGAYTPIDVPGRFVGSFMAEWYPNG